MTREETVRDAHFVDAHVHIRDVSGLDAVLAAGVAVVRDSGLRDNVRDGNRTARVSKKGPAIVSARWAIYKKGGYGSAFGVPVDSREEITSEIIRLAGAGAAIIKVMASGMVSLREPGRITLGGFTEDELRFIVDEAGHAGLGVMAHANGEQAIISAARAGARSIEHGFFMTPSAIEVMAQAKTFWTPTVGALARAAGGETVAVEARAFADSLIRSHREMIRLAHESGVPLAIGTDCILPHHDYAGAYRAELSFFKQAGLSSDAVAYIASEGGMKLLGA